MREQSERRMRCAGKAKTGANARRWALASAEPCQTDLRAATSFTRTRNSSLQLDRGGLNDRLTLLVHLCF